MGLQERGYSDLGYASPGTKIGLLYGRLIQYCRRPILGLGALMGHLLETVSLPNNNNDNLYADIGDYFDN